MSGRWPLSQAVTRVTLKVPPLVPAARPPRRLNDFSAARGRQRGGSVSGLDNAIEGLEQALASSPQQTWRGLVRQRMASVHEALASERSRMGDSWQAAREGHLH